MAKCESLPGRVDFPLGSNICSQCASVMLRFQSYPRHGIYCLVVDLPLWKMMDFVSWDDEIPNIWENNPNVPNHQPVYV